MTRILTQYGWAFSHSAVTSYGKNNLVVRALRHSSAALDDEVLKLPSAGSKLAASHRIHRCGRAFAVAVLEAGLDKRPDSSYR